MKFSSNSQSALYGASAIGYSGLFLLHHFNEKFQFSKNPAFLEAFTYSLLLALFVALPLGFLVIFQCCLRRKETQSLGMSAAGGALIAFAFFGVMFSLTLCEQMAGFSAACVGLCLLAAIAGFAGSVATIATHFLPHCGNPSCKMCG